MPVFRLSVRPLFSEPPAAGAGTTLAIRYDVRPSVKERSASGYVKAGHARTSLEREAAEAAIEEVVRHLCNVRLYLAWLKCCACR